jgi:hypothetical protein
VLTEALFQSFLICTLVVISVVNLTLIDLPGLTKIAVGECPLINQLLNLGTLECGPSLDDFELHFYCVLCYVQFLVLDGHHI